MIARITSIVLYGLILRPWLLWYRAAKCIHSLQCQSTQRKLWLWYSGAFWCVLGGHRSVVVSVYDSLVPQWERTKEWNSSAMQEAIFDSWYTKLWYRISRFEFIGDESGHRRGLVLLRQVHDNHCPTIVRRIVLHVLCQRLVSLLPPVCIAELFVLFICGERDMGEV